MEKISTADYTAGLYTIVIANSDKILAKQRVIVQKQENILNSFK